MAKDLVRTRRNISRFMEMKSRLSGVSMKLITIKSHDAMATAMVRHLYLNTPPPLQSPLLRMSITLCSPVQKGVTKALTQMNKQMNAPALQKIMTDFTRENEISEITQEAIGDTLDDAFEEVLFVACYLLLTLNHHPRPSTLSCRVHLNPIFHS